MTLHPRNLILLVVLVVLFAVDVAMKSPNAVALERGPLVTGFLPGAVRRVVLRPATGAPVVLERTGEEDSWALPDRNGFPAYDYAVNQLFERVVNLSRSDRLSEEEDTLDIHGVGDSGLRLRFEGADGSALLELIQGAPAGLATGSNVRLAGGSDVFRAPGLPPVPATPEAWLDTRLLAFEPASVQGLTVSHDGGRVFLDLRRDKDGWQLLNEPAGRAPRTYVERVLEVASTLVFTDVLEAEVSPDNGFGSPPETMLEIDLGDEGKAAVWIGYPTGDGTWYATNPDWEPRFCVGLSSRTAEVVSAVIEALAESVR